jgi:hypothetical protein
MQNGNGQIQNRPHFLLKFALFILHFAINFTGSLQKAN